MAPICGNNLVRFSSVEIQTKEEKHTNAVLGHSCCWRGTLTKVGDAALPNYHVSCFFSADHWDSRLGGVGHGVCQVTATVFVENQCFKRTLQASKLPSYCINLELCKFILCQMCATAPFHLKKIFRRSNKYLLRRYKRNMFRVVFR